MEPTRLFDLIYYQQAHFPQAKAFGQRVGQEWKYYSTDEVISLANKISRGLLKLGIQPGDRIGVSVNENRPEWVILDIGILQIGAINVPVYPTLTVNDFAYIFNDSEAILCFSDAGDLYERVKEAQTSVPTLKQIYTFDRIAGVPFWEDVFSDEGQEEVDQLKKEIDPEGLATIIYTSGTTGLPKGVMLSHRNIISNLMSNNEAFPLKPGDSVISFLPLCHIYERAVTYLYTYKGVSVSYTGTDNLGGEKGDLMAIKPHFFTTVPRLLEKVYERIYNRGLGLTGIKKKLFFWALKLAENYQYDYKPSGFQVIRWKIADRLIYSKWREALGGNIKGIGTGAAACPRLIAQVFSAAGVPIREGYGLSETSPVLTFNDFRPGGSMLGTVGAPIPGVEIYIDPADGIYQPGEGEILASGPNIMMGYYKKPDATAEVTKIINGKQWFCTGDVGKMVAGPGGVQFLKITDRKKELLKTSGGKYVAPTPIESKFREEFLIEQMMVVGEQRKFVSALIVPAEDALKDWCKNQGIEWTQLYEVIEHPKVVSKFQEIINTINPNFSHIDQIKKFRLLDKTWEPIKTDGTEAELTPTMKLKRRVILNKYHDAIEDMYVER
jgi:long-chain acyl-CoA synthetase